jgi:hypothetical protein
MAALDAGLDGGSSLDRHHVFRLQTFFPFGYQEGHGLTVPQGRAAAVVTFSGGADGALVHENFFP